VGIQPEAGTEERARARFAAGRVASLATVDSTGRPHLVPVTFAVQESTVWLATDGKPKRSRQLRRYANMRANPRVSLLVQHWDEDWPGLWWVRADGEAAITDTPATLARVTALLRQKYPQYRRVPIYPPLVVVSVHRWRWWSAEPQ
jgi:PPOX class probable F420-dependent enzyme